jgi:hypothetical protein
MRRILLAPPIAVFAAGCTDDLGLPSPRWPEGTSPPDIVATTVPSRDDLLRRWHLRSDLVWAPYAKYTLLTALDTEHGSVELPNVDSLEDVERARTAARALGRKGLPSDVLLVVDLRGAASVAFGVTLSNASVDPVSLVPTFNNWPAQNDLVPAEQTLAALIMMTPSISVDSDAPTCPVFLLDAWRLAYSDVTPSEGVYDNRYMLSASDLPDANLLLTRGIRHVVYVVESRRSGASEADDLNAAFVGYEHAGISIVLMDLNELAQLDPREDWDARLVADAISVVPRPTIVTQAQFYTRFPGAFGGSGALSPLGLAAHFALGRGGLGGHGGGVHGGGG